MTTGHDCHSRTHLYHLCFSILSAVLLILYIGLAGVWQLSDLRSTCLLLFFLWGPAGVIIYGLIRRECIDAVEAATLSGCGSFVMMTAINCLISTFAYWFQPLRHLWPVFLTACFLLAAAQIIWNIRKAISRSDCTQFFTQISWPLVAIVLASLIVTARYQRPSKEISKSGASQFTLNGDQTYFASIAYELQRNSPPLQHPCRAGTRERAYHHCPHLTLAIAGEISGQEDLLRLNLTSVYSVVVVLHVLLAYCIARILGGEAAAWVAACMVFIAAIPLEPGSPSEEFFYFSWLPQATSTVEPALLTSPQMFYGLVPGMSAMLGLLTVGRNLASGRDSFRQAMLAAILTALTLKFRVHCFLVIAPCIFGFLAFSAVSTRRLWLFAPVSVGVLLVLLQFLEMQLPVYLDQSQSVSIGWNNVVNAAPFYSSWPGAVSLKALLGNPSQDTSPAWGCLCIVMFCMLNIVGSLQTICVGIAIRQCIRKPPMKWAAAMPILLLLSTVFAACFIRSGYDSYSVGGQVPFQLGWLLLPWAAAGGTHLFRMLPERLMMKKRQVPAVGVCFAAVLVLLQVTRGLSPIERKNLRESVILEADDIAAFDFVRSSMPDDAEILTNLLVPNYALWSGIGGRRTFLDYIPAGSALDPVLAPEDRTAARGDLIVQLYATENAEDFRQLLDRSHATHVIESMAMPLRLHPKSAVKMIWSSPTKRIAIWQVLPPGN